MNNIDKQYQELLQDILNNGVKKKDRTGTGTISVFGKQIRHKMSDGFPLLTTKKMAWKTMVTELLWFLRGDTNIKYLVDNGCNIWNGDAYKNYLKEHDPLNGTVSMEDFIALIKQNEKPIYHELGELGPIYGKQWRSWTNYPSDDWIPDTTDQIQNLINDLKTNPDSRRLMVSAWNVGELDQMVLPPCHYGFQVYTRKLSKEERIDLHIKKYGYEKYKDTTPTRAISLMWNQRSVDTFLGLPFNIASYGLLLEIIAKTVNMVPDELIGNLGDTHLYLNHIEQAKEQIGRKYTPEERTEMLKEVMGYEAYHKAVDELMPFGGGLSEYYNFHKIPYYTREPFKLPTLKFNPIFLANLEHKGLDEAINGHVNFELENYQSHPTIKAPLSN